MLSEVNELRSLYTKVYSKVDFKYLEDYLTLLPDILKYVNYNLTELYAQNSKVYSFFVHNDDIDHRDLKRTRPFNSKLILSYNELPLKLACFRDIMHKLRNLEQINMEVDGKLIIRVIYTIHQCIGFILDLASNTKSAENSAKSKAGWHFENLLKCFFNYLLTDHGIRCKSRCIGSCRQDLVFTDDTRKIKVICSVKTTTKDRCSQFFTDRPNSSIPYIIVVLNDIQRSENGIRDTFLPSRFKEHVERYGSLDGFYYIDFPYHISQDKFFDDHICSFDVLLSGAIWQFFGLQNDAPAKEINEYSNDYWYENAEVQHDIPWIEDIEKKVDNPYELDSWLYTQDLEVENPYELDSWL